VPGLAEVKFHSGAENQLQQVGEVRCHRGVGQIVALALHGVARELGRRVRRAVVWEEPDVADEQAADYRVLADPDRGTPLPADPRTGPSQPPGNLAITPPTCAMAYQRAVRSPPVGGRRERTPARSDCSLTDPAFQGTAFYVHRRKRHSTLRQIAGKQSFTRHGPARLDVSPRHACEYRLWQPANTLL
jgi:hypothetical protein